MSADKKKFSQSFVDRNAEVVLLQSKQVVSGQWSRRYLQLATDVNKCICLELLELPELLELQKTNHNQNENKWSVDSDQWSVESWRQ